MSASISSLIFLESLQRICNRCYAVSAVNYSIVFFTWRIIDEIVACPAKAKSVTESITPQTGRLLVTINPLLVELGAFFLVYAAAGIIWWRIKKK